MRFRFNWVLRCLCFSLDTINKYRRSIARNCFKIALIFFSLLKFNQHFRWNRVLALRSKMMFLWCEAYDVMFVDTLVYEIFPNGSKFWKKNWHSMYKINKYFLFFFLISGMYGFKWNRILNKMPVSRKRNQF